MGIPQFGVLMMIDHGRIDLDGRDRRAEIGCIDFSVCAIRVRVWIST